MIIRRVLEKERETYNQVVEHPLQSWEWGEFKEKTGMRAVRLGVFEKGKIVAGFQVLLRPIPKLGYSVGHLLKSPLPNNQLITALRELADEEKAIFIKLEPDYIIRRWRNIKGKPEEEPVQEEKISLDKLGLDRAKKPLFDPYSFILDLTKSEDELLANMHHKTRYNIRLAQKKGVIVEEKSDQEGLEIFIDLLQETLRRQKFYLHSPDYFRKMWRILAPAGIAHILLARYQEKVLNAWMLFVWKDKLFYPYGASSSEQRNLMASNLICWEAIRFGKKMGCKSFDLWGGLGPKADPDHPWYGFHRFKLGYGADLVEYVGSWDLVVQPLLYQVVTRLDSLRWRILRLKRRLIG